VHRIYRASSPLYNPYHNLTTPRATRGVLFCRLRDFVERGNHKASAIALSAEMPRFFDPCFPWADSEGGVRLTIRSSGGLPIRSMQVSLLPTLPPRKDVSLFRSP